MATVGQTFQSNMVQSHQPQIFTFLKGQPKALGTVQIMIGMITLLFGIVLVSDPPYAPVSVISGNVFWASIFYIITGSLSVAAESNIQNCLVQGSLGMNVVSALMSAAGIGVLTTDLFLQYYCYSYQDCYRFEARSKSISAVLLIFTILQFIISICISVFACKATCDSATMVPIVTYTNQAVSGNPQVPISTFGNQAFQGAAHNVVYIPQTEGNNMSNSAPQNFHGWSHSR
ncbi:membrane-spanning 4-domains subfamily A member 8-like [Silurus meridionalis]|uniref:membrane-spanning 4-domains subfamily A member 8-like n=1 Tax=Silurus meridionalis TaxID=175797 RepID=UPI001EEA5B6B|nr:membrane-spanning 4-domains subfamily A member 8-like [Silurus meridionalis]XP_046711158.1 membrane-spanning 4-domains subfamily A member 8-like [Silurus meridionalis]